MANKKKIESDALNFQVALQMGKVCDALEVITKDKFFRGEFAKRAKIFKAIAKAYRQKKRDDGKI